jgi:hypothetical protein
VRKPKDKAICEGLVKILMRYFRFCFRRSRFTSIAEINRALMVCIERINDQTHRRFGVSRRERFEKIEKSALKPLPSVEYDGGEWKSAKLHPDCYVAVDGDYYSAPHIHRHKKLRIKLTEHHVEIFLNLERLAIHPRCRQKVGQRIKILEHFPANSMAFYEATPQKLLSQSRFIHPDLNTLFLSSSTPTSTLICAAPWAWSPRAPRRSVARAMRWRMIISLPRSQRCAATTGSAHRTSRTY